MDKQKAGDSFALFVRAVEGAMVRRHGTKLNIGVTADGKGSVKWDTETIHALTQDEVNQYGHLYKREIEAEPPGLIVVSREAWEAQRKAQKAAAKEAAEKTLALTSETAPSVSTEKVA
jgi:hypothetical protein